MQETRKSKILCVAGARPNFMKIAPIISAINKSEVLDYVLVHTGQHYDIEMNHQFFEQLEIPDPDISLGVGSGSHAVQTAEIMRGFEPVLEDQAPVAVLVVGDVNSTIACALVASKKGVPVIHVEAGLRSYDRSMPEEINRVLTDQLSDVLFTTERNAEQNLVKEGIERECVHFVGNVMIDTLFHNLPKAVSPETILSHVCDSGVCLDGKSGYALLTLHRPSNVDCSTTLSGLLDAVKSISDDIPVVFPVHPRTLGSIKKFKLSRLLDSERIMLLPPLGYFEMLGLMSKARIVLTDSGGVQEETTALGVPCITLRENTERPVTIDEGTNTVVGTKPDNIFRVVECILSTGGKKGRIPEGWDGKSAERIVGILEKRFC